MWRSYSETEKRPGYRAKKSVHPNVRPYLLCRQEVDVQQLPLAIHERQESDSDIIVRVEVGARTTIVVAVVLHSHQGREVSPCVTQGYGALPAETLLP